MDDRIILEKNKNINSWSKILIKDIKNENLIYEIQVKISSENQLEGIGYVTDFRTDEYLIVNFNNNNIISISKTNFLDTIPLYKDKEEYNMNKNKLKQDEKIIDNIESSKEIIQNKIDIKNEIIK